MTEAITKIIEAALKQAADQEGQERHRLPWDDGSQSFPVANLPLDKLLLNHNSHRIKAQLSARPDRAELLADPLSEKSQTVIAALLRATERFEDLKADVEERGQADPGVVTRAGILINGNTRAVALRDLKRTHFRAMVLPAEATTAQITELELRLQVSKDYKQEYTFTNRLLFIKDCIDAGWKEDRVAAEVHGSKLSEPRRREMVRRDLRVLAMVDELVAMSEGRLGYPDFDEKAVALTELDRDYDALKKSDAGAALRLRAARQVAILAGVGYREIREIDENFAGDHLEEAIQDDDELSFLIDGSGSATAPEGLDLLGGVDVATSNQTGEKILKWLTDTAGQDEVEVTTAGGGKAKRPREDVVAALQTAVEESVRALKAVNQRGNILKQPTASLKQAVKSIKAAESAYSKASKDANFESHVSALSTQLGVAGRAVDSLKKRLETDFPEAQGS